MSNEYKISSGSCNYKNLGNYSESSSTMPALASTTSQDKKFVIPSYGGVGYDTLNHGKNVPSCSGYFNIQSAYGSGVGNCNSCK